MIPQHQKGRAEASHSSVSFNDNKDCRQIILRPQIERPQPIAKTFTRVFTLHWTAHFISPCTLLFQGYPRRLKSRGNVKVLRYLTGKQLPESKHKCSPEQVQWPYPFPRCKSTRLAVYFKGKNKVSPTLQQYSVERIQYAQKICAKSCGVWSKHRWGHTVEQVLISGHIQCHRDATTVVDQPVRPAVMSSTNLFS